MKRPDWLLLLTTGLLTVIGMLVIYSSGGTQYLFRQLLFLPVAIAAMVVAVLIPRRIISGLALPLYLLSLILLAAVLLVGRGTGVARWLAIGPITFQPSELAKLSTIILLARYLAERREPRLNFSSLSLPVIICLLPAILIIAEPDLSTTLMLGVILAAILYMAGLKPLQLLLLYIPALSFAAGFSLYAWIPLFAIIAFIFIRNTTIGRTIAVLALTSGFGLLSPLVLSMLHDYQRARISNFLAPWLDPLGVGWNAIQSRIAIGSGRLVGKGFTHGTQGQLGFLPNRHTDFVFSCLGEEFGFIGSMTVLGLFVLHINRILLAARRSRDRFAVMLCTGIAAVFGYQVFVNVGMLLGLMPITGIALPFISYGGSGLVIQFAMVGLALNTGMRPE